MVIRYITYLLKETGLRILNYFLFPIAWICRNKLREKNKGFWWGFLHDGCDYGDPYFFKKHGNKKTLWTAYKWAMRNPCHNWYYSHKINGKKENYNGWATCQKPDAGKMWRTLKTCDKQGIFKDKYGKWIDTARSVLGKQRITFFIEGKKYFRYSGCVPKKIIGTLYYCLEYKFGFESSNWSIQFHPFIFKRYNKKIIYDKIIL